MNPQKQPSQEEQKTEMDFNQLMKMFPKGKIYIFDPNLTMENIVNEDIDKSQTSDTFENVHSQAKSLQKIKENSMKQTKDVKENQVDKIYFEEIKAKSYTELQNELKLIAQAHGFRFSQGTGLKSEKYVYFYCSHFERKSKFAIKDKGDKTKGKLIKNVKIIFNRFAL